MKACRRIRDRRLARWTGIGDVIAHFNQAVLLDPTFASAHLHLASAYAQQYKPGVDARENKRMGQLATVQFEQVLGLEPNRDQQVSALTPPCVEFLSAAWAHRAQLSSWASPMRSPSGPRM
jgi:hypothetical protein